MSSSPSPPPPPPASLPYALQFGTATLLSDTYQYVTNLLFTPSVVLVVALCLLFILAFSSSAGTSSSSSLILVFFVLLLCGLALWNGWRLLFGSTVLASLQDSELDLTVQLPPPGSAAELPDALSLRPQVFNIPGNRHNYQDAKALCQAYGARLATYQEVENAYRAGGEWCNYGWSEGQMALFPTQQATYDKLQTIPGHENDCGRPGVNGGYMANPRLQFGVNCFGYKPAITPEEADIMATRPLYPKTMQDIALEKRVEFWKKRLGEVLVSPFNPQSWSRY